MEKDEGLGESSLGTCVPNHMKGCPVSILERWLWRGRKRLMLGNGGEEEEFILIFVSVIKGRRVANGQEKKKAPSRWQVFPWQETFRESSANLKSFLFH